MLPSCSLEEPGGWDTCPHSDLARLGIPSTPQQMAGNLRRFLFQAQLSPTDLNIFLCEKWDFLLTFPQKFIPPRKFKHSQNFSACDSTLLAYLKMCFKFKILFFKSSHQIWCFHWKWVFPHFLCQKSLLIVSNITNALTLHYIWHCSLSTSIWISFLFSHKTFFPCCVQLSDSSWKLFLQENDSKYFRYIKRYHLPFILLNLL